MNILTNNYLFPVVTALVLTLSGCANRSSASASAEAPSEGGSVATYASTDDEDQGFVYGRLTMSDLRDEPQPEGDSEGGPHSQPQPADVAFAVDKTLFDDCEIDRTLYFEHDSSEVGTVAEMKLDQVARCLKQSSMNDTLIEIIGHADEQGSEDYNRELGLDRANAVAKVLASDGVEHSRMETYSRGEHLADEPGLWDDRRVIIRLAK